MMSTYKAYILSDSTSHMKYVLTCLITISRVVKYNKSYLYAEKLQITVVLNTQKHYDNH